MRKKGQIHDRVAGGVITLGVLLGVYVNPAWLWLPGILGVTLLQSGLTGFCPVYYTSWTKPVRTRNATYLME